MLYFSSVGKFYYNGEIKTNKEDLEIPIPRPSILYEWDGEKWILIEEAMKKVRSIRNFLLGNSDRYMMIDFPITDEERNKWKSFRQELRDFPNHVDLKNLVWPTPPTSDLEWDPNKILGIL